MSYKTCNFTTHPNNTIPTPLHQLNNVAAGINSSYNNQFDTTVALKPVSDGVADSAPDATSDAPPFVYHISTAGATSVFTPINNGDSGVYNSVASSQKISTNKSPNTLRASVVTPTNEVVDEAVNFIRNHLGTFDNDTRKAIVERLHSLENGTVSHDESKPLHLQSQQCIKLYPPEQNCELHEKVLTKDTSLNEEVDDTVFSASNDDDNDGIDISTTDQQSTYDMESDVYDGLVVEWRQMQSSGCWSTQRKS